MCTRATVCSHPNSCSQETGAGPLSLAGGIYIDLTFFLREGGFEELD